MDTETAQPAVWIRNRPHYQDLRATVMGLGRFGGGEAAVRFLAERGAQVIAVDLRGEAQLSGAVARLQHLPDVRFRFGPHDERDFQDADLIVVNPAVPLDNRFLQQAVHRGVKLTSEINLFWLHCPARIVGVTGTNGKSTTATLIHELLRAAGIKSRLGGNIGRSLLPEVDDISADETVVLELSSFQLEMLHQIRRSPPVAVVTGFSPNHLRRHRTVSAYRFAKQTLLRFQRAEDVAVLNADDESGQWPTPARRLRFGRREPVSAQLDESGVLVSVHGETRRVVAGNTALRGRHNLANLAAAMLIADVVGADLDVADDVVAGFSGLPHRLQFVLEHDGRSFINDSKATTPEATAAAIEALRIGAGRLILLAGGADKGVDLRPLAQRIAASVSAVALLGETAERLADLLDSICGADGPECCCPPSFEAAFHWAVAQSRAGDTVLLSPGCASYGWFDDFEARGDRFIELVRTHAARSATAP